MNTHQEQLQDEIVSFLARNPGQEQVLADRVLASRSSITRWSRGRNMPQKQLARAIISEIKRFNKERELQVAQ